MECEGLMDVETGVVSGLEDKLVCSFKLVTDVVWRGVRMRGAGYPCEVKALVKLEV